MHKDVECTFGIMKGRFRLLHYGFRFQSTTDCDLTWMTCCALHNLLLEVDGLHKNWHNGVRSDWEIVSDNSSSSNYNLRIQTPFSITRLNSPLSHNVNNESHNDNHNSLCFSDICNKYTTDGKRKISDMPLSVFKQCLVNHFDIRFQKNDIVWPCRTKKRYSY